MTDSARTRTLRSLPLSSSPEALGTFVIGATQDAPEVVIALTTDDAVQWVTTLTGALALTGVAVLAARRQAIE